MPMRLLLVFVCVFAALPLHAQHNAGQPCRSCHPGYSVGGTVFAAFDGGSVLEGTRLQLFRADGSTVTLPPADADGRVWSGDVPDGAYLPQLGEVRAHTWHDLPAQGDCNACHLPGGNGSPERTLLMQSLHTELAPGNGCTACHHYPASNTYAQLRTPGTLNGAVAPSPVQGSTVIIRGRSYPFDPAEQTVRSVRPDIFAEGYFSFFDMLLTAAAREGIPVEYHWDDSCQTHFIDRVDGVTGDFWYHFSYDAGSGTSTELRNRRQIRWDELLYQPGSSVQLVMGEDLNELRDAFKREIVRERAQGHVIPEVRISITPSDFRGNPDGSGRITVTRSFAGVHVTSHDLRVAGGDSLYRMPFKPGVVTAMDVLYSLQDAGELTLVGRQYFTRLAGKVMESFRVRAIGFPGTGEAHASGRQGFVYTTGNGTFTRLVNDADRKQHVHADIHVIHAPDIALWRWIELGNPYYEDDDPTGTREMLADYDALPVGFRLQLPWPQPASGIVRVSVNVFDDAEYRVDACDINGRRVATLHEGRFGRTGVSSIAWDVTKMPAGTYLLRCSDGRSVGVQRLQVIH